MLKIGAAVNANDGQAGTLAKVVLDPTTNKITDLVVNKGNFQTADRVVPIGNVESWTDDAVYLNLSIEELEQCPVYEEREFDLPVPGWESASGYGPDDALFRGTEYISPLPQDVPLMHEETHEGVDSDKPAIGQGTEVRCLDDSIGTVDDILMDETADRITHIVVEAGGGLSKTVAIPLDWVSDVTDDYVYIEKTREEIESLPEFELESVETEVES